MRVGRLLLATFGLLALATTSARATDDNLDSVRSAWLQAGSPKERINVVPRIVALRTPNAAFMLSKYSRTDPDVLVRAAAARGLGTMDVDGAIDLLVEGVTEGGPRLVRETLARALAKRRDGAEHVLRAIDDPKTSTSGASLLVLSLASFKDPLTLAALTIRTRSTTREIRQAALRALAMRRDAREARVATLARALGDARDTESLLATLDAAEMIADPMMRPILTPLSMSTEPAVRESAAYVLDQVRRIEEAAARKADAAAGAGGVANDRYSPPEDDTPTSSVPPVLPARGRYDLMYAIDVTGSASTTIEDVRRRIEREIALFARVGASTRVGVVTYRGGHGVDAQRAMDVLTPCYDPKLVTAFLDRVVTGGVDSQGAAVASALSLALDRTPWRWDARRDLCLLADSICDQPDAAKATVGIHFTADGTRSSVTYVLRTRRHVPPEYDELAKLGGTEMASWIR